MRLVFIDETSDAKFKEYLGLSVATINYTKYAKVKTEFQNVLLKSGWDENIEFKGSCLFSAKSGDANVSIDQRIEIAEKLIDLTASKTNARMSFHYLNTKKDPKKHRDEYLRLIPVLLKKALPKAPSGAGKNTIFVSVDQRSDVSIRELHTAILPVILEKKYILLEQPIMATSNFHTIGILYADIIGYLAARIDNISNDMELFEGISLEQAQNNGKIRKLTSSKKLMAKVKNIGSYRIVEK